MSDDWEAEDYEPTAVLPVVVKSDKWEGEDEEEPVKDSWEDEDEEKKDAQPASTTTAAVPAKKKASKKLEEKIAEKERKEREEAESRRRNEEANLTPEEKMAEKLRRQKLVEDSDFELAKETFGVSRREGSIDDAEPTTKEQFAELRNNLVKKMQSLSLKENYNDFVEELIRDICVGLEVEVLKKISNTTKSLHEEKLRMAKAAAKGGKKGGKIKVVLKVDKETDLYGDDFGGGDYDDFM